MSTAARPGWSATARHLTTPGVDQACGLANAVTTLPSAGPEVDEDAEYEATPFARRADDARLRVARAAALLLGLVALAVACIEA